ncbi:uncharacterized protein P174DRAFT_439469 [Aspergillus novofumigatus IBT 16806]|uniref:Uncharacterized protein n=1 Tax=Aspergillus novofumigatus (strain IBT 16806) TaxID=1392255 RepID=A0A2I1CJC8_ASPN1|nr:uncharacterized protein P174DRAFT_439469 [Aspergillus novofumigatus IBT 16806]PKX97717.1 hypothetical protein P174DRAFT_439469 [Aspergillus novofumigatus IBT 16806]
MAVFEYFNIDEVNDCLVLILNNVRQQYRIANRAWNLQHPDQAFDVRPIWDLWVRHHFSEMVTYTRTRITYWLDRLDSRWTGISTFTATRALQDVQRIRNRLNTIVRLSTDGLASDIGDDSANDPPAQIEPTDREE